jgi:hypothetical protein
MVPSVSTPPAQHLHASRVLESRACGHDATYRHTCCDAEQFKSATRTDPPALQCLSSSELPGAPLSREGSNTLYWKRSGLTNRLGVFQVYKKDWVSWPDWLGYCEGKPPVGTFLVFEEAREVARAQKISGQQEVRRRPFDSSLSKAVVKEQLMATHTAPHSGQPTEHSSAAFVGVAVVCMERPTVGCAINPIHHIRGRGLGVVA